MRIAFYLKLFIAFLVFAAFLLMLFFFLSNSFHQRYYEEISHKTFEEFLADKKEEFERHIVLQNRNLQSITQSLAYETFIQKNDANALKDMLQVNLLSNEDIIEYKIINKYSQESLSLVRDNDEIRFSTDVKFNDNFNQKEYFQLLKLKDSELWHSEIKLLQRNGNIQTPLLPVLKFAIKANNHYVIAFMNMQRFFSQYFQLKQYDTYVLSSRGDFLVHPKQEYHWSAYFNPKKNLKQSFPRDFYNILNYEDYSTKSFISKQIAIDKNNRLVVLIEYDNSLLEEFQDSNYIMAVIGIISSIVLALLFSNPLAKLNKELEQEKENLNLSYIQNENLLDDSLTLIDKYVMYIKFDNQFKITDVSSYFCEVAGYDKGELIGQYFQKLLHKEVDFELICQTITQGQVYSGELKNSKKFGEVYWLASNIEPNWDSKKSIVSYTAICNNISYQKKIHTLYSDLNNQIEQLNAIFQNAKSGIALLNYQGAFENINVAFANLLKFSNEELLEENIYSLIVDNQHEFLETMVKQAKEFGSMNDLEVIMLSKHKEYVHLNISLSVLPNKSHIVLVANSLEDKRKLQELNSTLEQRINDEVAKNIEQEKLHQEQQIKNAKLTSIGTLAAGITHEINTPLTYLKGNFEMMQYDIEDLPDSSIKQNMLSDSEKITEAINRIANIVESMREMSQTSSESKDKTNLYATLVTSLTMAYNRSKQVSKIYLNNQLFDINHTNKNEFEYSSMVQKQRIEQVWVIIINNALDALQQISDYEQRALYINFIESDEEIIVRFADNAGGIKEEILNNIFDPFISTKEHSGMGVGLNIAKKIIDEQEAQIKAYNEKGGAVFEVTFQKIV